MASMRRAVIWGAFAIVGFIVAIVYQCNEKILTLSVPASSAVLDKNGILSKSEGTDANVSVTRNVELRPDSTWQLSLPVASSIDVLIAMALSGNNEARYILARNLEYCYYSAKSEPEYERKRQQVLTYSDADTAVTRIDERYRYCTGIKPSAFEGFLSHLEASAAAGFVLAQEHYGSINSNLYMQVQGFSSLERDVFIAKRTEFVNRKIAFLDHAMRAGSIRAMARLSEFASQQLYSYGLVEAYAINITIMHLTDDNTLYNRYAWLNERLEQRLTQTEVLQALTQSEALIATINSSSTLSRYNEIANGN
jgi:hypothetical protein